MIDVIAQALEHLAWGGTATLLDISPAPTAQRRTSDPEGRSDSIFTEALKLRAATGLPFWDAVFLTGETRPDGIPADIVDGALLHQSLRVTAHRDVPIDQKAHARMLERSQTHEAIVALSSEVRLTSGEIRHLPMIDFASKSRRPGSAQSVITAARRLGIPGFVMESGRSYHFYGAVLLTQDELRRHLSRTLLLAPVTDARWIAHQLLDGMCSLRISPNANGDVPTVVASV
ncbi:primase 1D-like protein [Curtobacterium sp. SAFR-003]|uniref:primase 1D-like protein n=1 Tax=Curtobacterium sp. SAFR-003 TaxID=3387276 RepID=UPI003F7EDABF